MAVIIPSTHYSYTRKDGQAELTWVAWSNIKTVYSQMVTDLSSNGVHSNFAEMSDNSATAPRRHQHASVMNERLLQYCSLKGWIATIDNAKYIQQDNTKLHTLHKRCINVA